MKKIYTKPDNDNLSTSFEDIVPEKYKGTDRFLDICNWNIRYFHNKDKKRVERISQVMNAINADIFVLVEILEGSLEPVAARLKQLGAGHYRVAYGTTGGDQRVAIMYDLDWVRAKSNISELFEVGSVKTENGKDAFPRLPLYGYFTCLTNSDSIPFDFQLAGVHLKSQRGENRSVSQRTLAAQKLKEWLENEATDIDADVIILGDFNESPESDTWEPLKKLEENGKALFSSINNKNEISHLMYSNNNKTLGSRLDLSIVSAAAANEMVDAKSNVIRWKSLEDFLSHNPQADEIKKYIHYISNNISDHMPVITRYYFEEQ